MILKKESGDPFFRPTPKGNWCFKSTSPRPTSKSSPCSITEALLRGSLIHVHNEHLRCMKILKVIFSISYSSSPFRQSFHKFSIWRTSSSATPFAPSSLNNPGARGALAIFFPPQIFFFSIINIDIWVVYLLQANSPDHGQFWDTSIF